MPAPDAHSISSGPLGNGPTSWVGYLRWDGCSLLTPASILLLMLGQGLDHILQPLQSHAALSLSSALVP